MNPDTCTKRIRMYTSSMPTGSVKHVAGIREGVENQGRNRSAAFVFNGIYCL